MSVTATWARRFGRAALIGMSSMIIAAGCGSDGGGGNDDGGNAAPVCGDGEINGSDQCDGTNIGAYTCATAGFDEGAVICNDSCLLDVTACYLLDEDLDGLTIDEETALGTDPVNPDSDTDGVLDGFEVQNASNPLDLYSWPQGLGSWPNRLAAAGEAGIGSNPDILGFGVGDSFYNYIWTDQFGQRLELWQMYGYVIVLSAGARWCGPCQQAASNSQNLWDEYRDQGVIFVENILDGLTPGVDATPADIDAWVNQFGLEYPITMVDEGILPASAIPTYFFLDRNMVVRETFQGFPGDQAIAAEIDAILADG
jgi:thiol-disulfide isomerase/thioredoxin